MPFIWRGVGHWDKFCSLPFFLIPLFFSKMLMVLYKRSHLHFSHLPTHEMFWMPSVVIYKAINKIEIKKDLSQMPISHLSLSLCLSFTVYWYNYSPSPHVPLATDEEWLAACPHRCLAWRTWRVMLLCLLPYGGMLPEGSSCGKTHSNKYSETLFWSTRQDSGQFFRWYAEILSMILSFIRNKQAMLPALTHFIV